jgi:predicted Rossmann fold flavoprotein
MNHFEKYDLVVCGAGAAGVFAAIRVAEIRPSSRILILEKSPRMLEKVKVSGGGRCNITNAEEDYDRFAAAYPRGRHFMRKALRMFGPGEMLHWFEQKNLFTHAEEDGRIFPTTNSSASVIRCFSEQLEALQIELFLKTSLKNMYFEANKVIIESENHSFTSRSLLIAAGGNAINTFKSLTAPYHIGFEEPVPSLFTFNCLDKSFTKLMGLATEAEISIVGTKFCERGPLLITHWGFSGPPVLRCSAFAARFLADKNYHFQIKISWLPNHSQDDLRRLLLTLKQHSGKKMIKNSLHELLPTRLREALMLRAGCDISMNWADLPAKTLNKLVETFTADIWEIKGKTTFKEEFVTCGGINLNELNPNSMMLKKCPGIFAAGEIIDVDGITGGYNFQNAWTTAEIAARGIRDYLNQTV